MHTYIIVKMTHIPT